MPLTPITSLPAVEATDVLKVGKQKINSNIDILRDFVNTLAEYLNTMSAEDVPILDFGENFTAENVEDALIEINTALESLEAVAVSISDAGEYYASDNVEGALQEVYAALGSISASTVSVLDASENFTGENVEAVLAEIHTLIENLEIGIGEIEEASRYIADDGRVTGFVEPTVDALSVGSVAVGAGISLQNSESSISLGANSSTINQNNSFVLGVGETLQDTGQHSWWFTSQNPGAGFLRYYQTPGASSRRNDRYPGTLITADAINNDFVIDLENPENRTIGQLTLFIGVDNPSAATYDANLIRYGYDVIDLDTDTTLKSSNVYPYPDVVEYEGGWATGMTNYYVRIPIFENAENMRIKLSRHVTHTNAVSNFNFLFAGNSNVETKPITIAGDLKILSTKTIDKVTGDDVSEYYIVLGMSYGSVVGERPVQNSLINSQSSTHSESSRSSIINSRNSFIGASTDSVISNSDYSDIEISHQSIIDNSYRAFLYDGFRSVIQDSEHGWIDEGQNCFLRGDGAWINSSVRSMILNGGAVGSNGENWLDSTTQSVIINGVANWMSPAVRTTIVNGWGNYATGTAVDSAVLTGVGNSVYGAATSVLAGENNDNQANASILAGQDNSLFHDDYDVEYFYPTSSAIIGGRDNELTSRHSAILAGQDNRIRYSQNSIFAGDTIRAHHTEVGGAVDRNNLLAVVGSRSLDITNSERVTVGSGSYSVIDNVSRSVMLGTSSNNLTTPSSISYATHAGMFNSYRSSITGSTAGGRLWYATILGSQNATITRTEGETTGGFYNTIIGGYNVDILDSNRTMVINSREYTGVNSSITDSDHSTIENATGSTLSSSMYVKILNDTSSSSVDSGYSSIINGFDNTLTEAWYSGIQDAYYATIDESYVSRVAASDGAIIERQYTGAILASYQGKITSATYDGLSFYSNAIVASDELMIEDSNLSSVMASYVDVVGSGSEVISGSSKAAVIASLDAQIYDSDKAAIVGSWLSSIGSAENSSIFGSYSSAIYSYTNDGTDYDSMNSAIFGANAGRIVGEYSSNIFGGYINRIERGARWSTSLGGYFSHATRPFEITIQGTGNTSRDDPRSNKVLAPSNQEFSATTSLVSGSFRSASAASGYLDFTNVKAGGLRTWRNAANTQVYGVELFNRSTVSFKAYVTASNFDESKDESAYFEVTGAVDVRNGVARILGSVVVNTIHSDVVDWDVSVDLETIDVTNTWGSLTVAQNQYRIPPVALLRFSCENPTAGTDVIHWYGKVELSNLDF